MATAPSRYRKATLVVSGQDLYYGPRPTLNTSVKGDDRYVDVVFGDTLHSLAQRTLGDFRFWWVIAEFNDLLDPFADLAAGTVLRVPSVTRLWMELLK